MKDSREIGGLFSLLCHLHARGDSENGSASSHSGLNWKGELPKLNE